jgi:hypothetical protein
MPRLDELDLFVGLAGTPQRAKHPVYAIAGIAKNNSNAPFVPTLDQKIAHCHRHTRQCARHVPALGAPPLTQVNA